jgi:two-component system cell cycle sensor histidine kinase/response regulator CckA
MRTSPSGKVATVLVVDDELAIQQLITAILTSRGYKVLEARHAVHALQLCKQHPGPIDLLLTDILMPHMNGRELATHALAFRPQMRVLYISGYEAGVLMQGFGLEGDVAFLQKPFAPGALLQKVHDTLGSPG